MKWNDQPRRVFEFIAIAVCTTAFALTALGILTMYFAPGAAGKRDFVEYWAAAQQLAHHANPYDEHAIGALERSAGYPKDYPPLIMGNAPWSLVLVLPLGFFNATVGEILWLATMLVALVLSITALHLHHGNIWDPLDIFAYSFAPVLACIWAGQIAIFILVGSALFFRWHIRRPFMAGAMLWFCLLKPHLFIPLGVVLLAWCAIHLNYRLIAGIITGLSITTLIAMAIDPSVWTHYRQAMQTQRLDRLAIPCVSSVLRQLAPPHTFWLQCTPALLGSAVALWYFTKNRSEWNWRTHGNLVLLISVLCAPYSWLSDQAILLPAIMTVVYQTASRPLIAVLALMSAVVEMQVNSHGGLLHSNALLWTAPCWLIWYLIAARAQSKLNKATADLLPAVAS